MHQKATNLKSSQPKVSHYLALLKVETERQGQWVYYYLHPCLFQWLARVLGVTSYSNVSLIKKEQVRLRLMNGRPAVRFI
jgi:ArsR family transcriptional regulator